MINKTIKFTDHIRGLYFKAGNTELPKGKRLIYAEKVWTELIAFIEDNKDEMGYESFKILDDMMGKLVIKFGSVSRYYSSLDLSTEYTLYEMKAFSRGLNVSESDTYINHDFQEGLESFKDWDHKWEFILRFLNERLPHVLEIWPAKKRFDMEWEQEVKALRVTIRNRPCSGGFE